MVKYKDSVFWEALNCGVNRRVESISMTRSPEDNKKKISDTEANGTEDKTDGLRSGDVLVWLQAQAFSDSNELIPCALECLNGVRYNDICSLFYSPNARR